MTSFREIHISFMLMPAVRRASRARPASMILSKSSTLTKLLSRTGRAACSGGNAGAGNVMLLVQIKGELLPASLLRQPACLFLDQIKREKGVWWMPWQ